MASGIGLAGGVETVDNRVRPAANARQASPRRSDHSRKPCPKTIMIEDSPEEPAQPLAAAALVAAAQREGVRPPRSRLDPCAQVIFILRDKHWSFAAITDWLARHGVQVAESTVQRFYRSRCRRTDLKRRVPPPNDARPPDPFFDLNHENLQSPASGISAQPASKPKYNTDF